MKAFCEKSPSDLKLHKQILPACRYLKVKKHRGKNKQTNIKKLAKELLQLGYVIRDQENTQANNYSAQQKCTVNTQKQRKIFLENLPPGSKSEEMLLQFSAKQKNLFLFKSY